MGIFDFFKPNNKNNTNSNQPEKKLIAPNTRQEFDLKASDFYTKTHSAQVISTTVSADFYDLFPEAKNVAKSGNKVEVRFAIVDIVFWGERVEVSFDPDHVLGDLEALITKINSLLN